MRVLYLAARRRVGRLKKRLPSLTGFRRTRSTGLLQESVTILHCTSADVDPSPRRLQPHASAPSPPAPAPAPPPAPPPHRILMVVVFCVSAVRHRQFDTQPPVARFLATAGLCCCVSSRLFYLSINLLQPVSSIA